MIDESMVLLQNFMGLEKDILGVYSEICPTFHDGNRVSSVKAECVSDIKEEEEKVPVPVTFQAVNAEREVSCMSVSPSVCPLLIRFQRYPELHMAFLISSCLFLHPHERNLL